MLVLLEGLIVLLTLGGFILRGKGKLSPRSLCLGVVTLLGTGGVAHGLVSVMPWNVLDSILLTQGFSFVLWGLLFFFGVSTVYAVKLACFTPEKRVLDWDSSLLLLLALLVGGLTFLHLFTSFNLYFHSDQATPNLLALEQWRTKSLFPTGWHYGTSIWLVFHNLWIMPLSVLSENQLFLQNLAVAGLVLGTCGLVVYVFGKYLKSTSYLLFFCYFFANTSYMMIDMSFAAGSYLPWLFEFFCFIALYFGSFSEDFSIKNKKCCVAFCLYGIYLLLYGVQFLIFHHVPLFGGVLLTFALAHWQKEEKALRGYYPKLALFLGIAFSIVLVGMVGHGVLISQVHFNSVSTSYSTMEDFFDRFLIFLLTALGYESQVGLFTLQGVMNLVIVFVFLASLWGVKALYSEYHSLSYPVQIFCNICMVSILFTLYFNFAIYSKYISYIRYMYKALIPLFFLSSYYYYELFRKKGFIPRVLLLLVALCYALPMNLVYGKRDIHYEALHQEQTALVDFLQGEGLTYGFATFWHAYEHMVLSDFQVMIHGVLIQEEKVVPHLWLTSDYYYQEERHQGESFLLLTQEEEEAFLGTKTSKLWGEPSAVHSILDYVVYVYPFFIAEHEFLGSLERTSLMDVASRYGDVSPVETGDLVQAEGRVFGPYLALPSGNYILDICSDSLDDGYFLSLTASCGDIILRETEFVDKNYHRVTFHLEEPVEDFEVVLTTSGAFILEGMFLTGE